MDKKKYAILMNVILLVWYALSMFGLKIGGKYLVEGAFREEWIFMLIPTVTFLLYIFVGKIGKYIHLIWLVMWLITQFMSHEWYTIFGSGFMGNTESKIEYFKNCIQLFNYEGRYIPDLYHILLHVFIVLAMIGVIIVPSKTKKK